MVKLSSSCLAGFFTPPSELRLWGWEWGSGQSETGDRRDMDRAKKRSGVDSLGAGYWVECEWIREG